MGQREKPIETPVYRARAGARTFNATLRSKRVSRARYNLAHPTRAEERDDFVRPECRAGLEGHVFGVLYGPVRGDTCLTQLRRDWPS